METMLDGSTNGADLTQRLTVATTGALELFAVHLGSQLGLYDELDRHGPLTVRDLAERSGIHERYAREWLEQQAVAGLLTFADDRFALPAEHRGALVDPIHQPRGTPMTITNANPLVVTDVTSDNRAAAVRVLSAAFQDDPVFEWWIPDHAARAAALPTVFDAYIDAYASHEATRVASLAAGPAGVSMWARPGGPLVLPDDEAAMVARCLTVVDDGAAQRLQEISEAFGAVHPEERHWYLQFLATDPPLQSRGVGGTLLGDILGAVDEAGEAAYTEATSLRNRALYERHGFVFTREIPLPDGPSLYAMWRDPR